MDAGYPLLLVLFYGSLALELTCWHVPSVASSLSIFRMDPKHIAQFSAPFQRWFGLPRWQKVLCFVLPLGAVLAVHLFPLLPLLPKVQDKPTTPAILRLVGIILVLIGRVLSLFYLYQMHRIETADRFVVSGVFRFSRNPGLVGLYLSFLGFLFVLPYPSFAACLAVYMLYMHSKIRMEEDFLRQKFGYSYDEYLRQTRRYL